MQASPALLRAGIKATAAAVGERVRQDIALDAPFYALKKEQALARMPKISTSQKPSSERGEAAPLLGLVSNETKAAAPGEAIQICPHSKRLKRMKTGVEHAARLIEYSHSAGGQRWNKKLVTLTYARVEDWEPTHLRQFQRRVTDWLRRKGIKSQFVWVAELQKRGAVHYHMILWVPRGVLIPHPDKRGWWSHGSSNVKPVTSPVSYIAKYASKSSPLDCAMMPSGARMHGAGGLTPEDRRHIRYWQAPIWVRDGLSGRADIRKVKGGYVDKFTGEFLESEWAVFVRPDGRVYAIKKTRAAA